MILPKFISSLQKQNFAKKATIALITLAILAALGFLGYRYLAPFGKTVYYRFTSKIPGAEEATTFSPGKDSILKIPSQIIKTNVSKFSLELLSKDIKSIKATLKFKKGPKEIKLGVKGNEKDNFFYQPLYHLFIQDLNWQKAEEGGFTFWQKKKKYLNLYDFINNPPLDAKTASYFVDQDKLALLKPTEIKKEAKTIIETPLRGSHALLIRIDKKPLILKIAKQDMNAYTGGDKFKIAILKEQNTLTEKTIEDDGIVDSSRLRAEPQEETITLEDIDPGIYQINITYQGEGYDSLITKIEVNQQKVVFKNNVFILGNKPIIVWTDASKINISTAHDAGLQTLKLNDKEELKIKEVGKKFSFDLESLTGKKTTDLYKLESPKNDLVISGDGYFAFSKDSFFYPEIVKSTNLNEFDDLENVDYVLTTCPKAKKEGDWLIAETIFDSKDIKIDGDKLYFSLESPELAEYGGELEIDYLEIEVKSEGGLEKIFEKKAEEKEEKSVADEVSEGEKKNIFQKIGQFFGNIFNKTKGFFVNSYHKIFKKKEKTSEETPSPSPTPTPTPTPVVKKISILVKVLNGGASKGAAGKFAEVLKKAGFTNVQADNADKTDYKNAIIRYRKEDKKEMESIETLLKEDYKTVEKKEIATTSAEIVIIIGEK